MNRKFIIISLFTLLALVFAVIAYAQDEELPNPRLLPDSPFYFLKNWAEEVRTFLTFGDVAEAKRFTHLAEVRLSETRALVEKGKPEIAAKTVSRYQGQLDKALTKVLEAKDKGHNVDDVLSKVAESTLKHQEVLAEVYGKVPEQARKGIEQALEVSVRGHNEAIEAISGQKQEEIKKKIEQKKNEVEQKLEDLRDKGVPVPELENSHVL